MTGQQPISDFNFFLPLSIEKSGTGKEKMVFRGIASTPDLDTDGEMLDPKGFDLSYFVNNGFINWNHKAKDDPSAIIGEPTVAKITKDGLYLEAELYNDNDTAKKVFALAKSLEKSKTGRKLGYSIEGKVLETDPLDKKKITKAKITGCAITPTPKNSSTYAELVKGHIHSDKIEFEPFFVKGDESEISVDEELNILFKSIDTEGADAVIPESLEGVKKKKQKSFLEKTIQFVKSLFEEDQKEQTKNQKISKAEIASVLIKGSPDLETFKNIFTVINNLSDMKIKEVNKDDLVKALDSLGLDSSEVLAELEKGEKANGGQETCLTAAKSLVQKGFSYKKAMKDLMEKGYDKDEAKESIIKAMDEEEDDDDDDDASTGSEKPNEDKIVKGQDDLVEFMKSEFSGFEERFGEKISNLGKIYKGLENQIQSLTEELEEIKDQPIQKSITSTKFLEKSFDGNMGKQDDGTTVLSLSKHKKIILKAIDTLVPEDYGSIQKGSDFDILATGAARLESTGQLPDQAKAILKTKGYEIIN